MDHKKIRVISGVNKSNNLCSEQVFNVIKISIYCDSILGLHNDSYKNDQKSLFNTCTGKYQKQISKYS